mgnify:CR=1 FL=1
MHPVMRSTLASVVLLAMLPGTVAQVTSDHASVIENEFLKIKLSHDWKAAESKDPVVILTKGRYRLTIDPMFTHASGIEGGRFSEITQEMKSLDAVMANVDQPAGGWECADSSSDSVFVTKELSLRSLYTDSSKVGSGCVFPSSAKSVWFGSFSGGNTSQTEYTITLYYDTNDVNELPVRHDPELERTFQEVAAILQTLEFKTPLVISRIDPVSVTAGETATIYGRGFRLLGGTATVRFEEIPETTIAELFADAAGRSLKVEVPTSMNVVSCQAGRIDLGGLCLPIPPGHVDTDDCPGGASRFGNFCGKPIPPGVYHVSVMVGQIISEKLPLTITAPMSSPISISLIFSNFMVLPGETITVRGRGFTPTGNTVHIGSAVVQDIASTDGRSITFTAPTPDGATLVDGMRVYKAWVSNSAGESNRVTFGYR